MPIRISICCLLLLLGCSRAALPQERPYFVTYDHYLEERGNLEVAVATTTGLPKDNHHSYSAPWLELEYGLTGWWTAEFYLEVLTTRGDGNGFTGWRFENRFRPLRDEHAFNPVLYVEYESINEASRIQKEIVGAGSLEFEPIEELREEHARELETKLIVSSTIRGWNIAENFILEKNLSADEGFEFGYSVGVSGPLARIARGDDCRFCPENFRIGAELYGGLGSTEGFERRQQRHYIAPALSWRVTDRFLIKGSVGVGLTEASDRALIRLGASYEFPVGGR